ncbi:ATP-binding protein (plasmid) [Skermanella sp. TT6]|uniref:ATP-binding protein n=1 Tax=Skermanella cutis TaxID=2775420 RepID=A0ABX7BK27_9PROT|nr:ATP-binding protein [Skermanella sp. TT6]QQP93589.1 ATP-binding protein [Skermanella sp. TT6]
MQRLTLRRIRIRGFKSLAELDLDFPDDLLILIGANGAGKTTVLQALAFIPYFTKGQPEAFFADRGWKPADLRSRVKTGLGQGTISYRLFLEGDDGLKVFWHFNYNLLSEKTVFEKLWLLPPGRAAPEAVIEFSQKGLFVGAEKTLAIAPDGSVLSIVLDEALAGEVGEAVRRLRSWGSGIFSLELLNPDAMRRGARGNPSDIGPRGERLAGFLASLPSARKARLVERLTPYFRLQGLETTRRRAGWIDMRIAESFEDFGWMGVAHMSDGFMRLLGLAAIPEFGPSASMVLLDEVENGIEPHILPDFISMIARESNVQLVLTSHSPSLVNQFEPGQIGFLARRPDGAAVAAPFSSLEPLVNGLRYLGAGEVWTITDMNRINEMVVEASHNGPRGSNPPTGAAEVMAFMGLGT